MFTCSFYVRRSHTWKKTVKSSVEKKVDWLVVLLYVSRFALYGVHSSLMKLTPDWYLEDRALFSFNKLMALKKVNAQNMNLLKVTYHGTFPSLWVGVVLTEKNLNEKCFCLLISDIFVPSITENHFKMKYFCRHVFSVLEWDSIPSYILFIASSKM